MRPLMGGLVECDRGGEGPRCGAGWCTPDGPPSVKGSGMPGRGQQERKQILVTAAGEVEGFGVRPMPWCHDTYKDWDPTGIAVCRGN